MTLSLSAFVITLNEEARLGRTLAALDWIDDVVVVDSGSTDRTEEIARTAGARFLHRDWTGYGAQKLYAEHHCLNDWVLNVDADEVVTPELAAEIRAIVAEEPEPAAWQVRILTVYPGRTRPRMLANDFNVVRLYHRKVASYRDHELFDRVVTNTNIHKLSAPIHHYSTHSWHQMVEKGNNYTTYAALNGRPRNRGLLKLRLIFQMPVSFFRMYIFHGHILGGTPGFVLSLSASFMRTLRIMKMLEKIEKRDLD